MGTYNQNLLSDLQVANQEIPTEGPRAIPLLLDFSVLASYLIDLLSQQQQTRISMVQTVYIDLKDFDQALTVKVEGIGQVIKAKGRTQGYYPILGTAPTKLTIASTAAGIVPVTLLNVPIAGSVWATQ